MAVGGQSGPMRFLTGRVGDGDLNGGTGADNLISMVISTIMTVIRMAVDKVPTAENDGGTQTAA